MRVAWTGFGQFAGVQDNPSSVLARRLAAQHAEDSVDILEVSAEAAKKWRCRGDADLVIHVGVAITYDAITLERCAYNDASFRVPDERGAQPQKAPIDAEEFFGTTRTTGLDLAAIARRAVEAGCAVNVSEDAGRFVCNYLYYCSLAGGPPCVFIHVPSLDRCPLEDQVATLTKLQDYLVEAISTGVDVLADVAAAAAGAGLLDQSVELGIGTSEAAFAVAAGCTSVEQAMELLFAEPAPEPGSRGPAPAPEALKMVLVVREDLGMSKGKVAAQCAHAALGGARRADEKATERWAENGETVVVVAAPDAGFLRRARDAAARAGLPHCLVADAGRTEVAPGTETVLAVGPGEVSRVDAITGQLRLLR